MLTVPHTLALSCVFVCESPDFLTVLTHMYVYTCLVLYSCPQTQKTYVHVSAYVRTLCIQSLLDEDVHHSSVGTHTLGQGDSDPQSLPL